MTNNGTQAQDEKITSEKLKQMFADSQDIVFNNICVNNKNELRLTVAFVDGMINSKTADDDILKPLIQEEVFSSVRTEEGLIDLIMCGTVYHCQRKLRYNMTDCVDDLLGGSVVLVFDSVGKAITFEEKGFERRNLTEPTNENVLKGSKEPFIEVLRVNTALVRRRIRASELKINHLIIGERTKTSVCVVYMQTIANDETVNEVIKRLSAIKIDGILSAGNIEGMICDKKMTIFPQLLYTERVDKFCANLLEGRVGIMIDGLPLAYLIPVNMNSFIQAPEDYALISPQSTFVRLIRYISMFVSVILPAFYVSVTTFHQEMIPTKLATSIISSKEDVPFPTFIEVLLMLLAFEVLLEAGLRLPKSIGQALSIVGALVIGEAAISANLLSPGVVIVVAAAGITGFVIPSQDLANADRLCRLFLVICSIIGGLYAVAVGIVVIVYHLCTIEAFGVPYLSPFVSNEGKQVFKDTLLRYPPNIDLNRPADTKPKDIKKQM
jgi:spore germination protein KA